MEVYETDRSGEDFMTRVYNGMTLMRLIVEGALYFYNERLEPLYHVAREKEMKREMEAYDHIGNALFDFRAQLIYLQEEYAKAQ